MLSTLAWSPFLLTLVPHAFKFLLDMLTKSTRGDQPRKGKQELHHRIILDLQKVGGDDSIYGQQVKRLLLDELVPAAKQDPREAEAVLRLKNWRELVARTERVAHLVEIRADAAGIPRVLWDSHWFRWLKGHPLISVFVAFVIYISAFTTTIFLAGSYAFAWEMEGWSMSMATHLLLPATMLSGVIAVYGFLRLGAIMDAWSACRYAAKLGGKDLLLAPESSTPPRTELRTFRRAASTSVVMSHGRQRNVRRVVAGID